MATKVAIIAGFEPFAEFDKNPSGQAVAHLEQFCAGFEAEALVLPVCCGPGWQMLKESVDKLQPDATYAVVMAGLASTRKGIEVERFALNCKDYRIPDNGAHQWTGEEIVDGAPAAIRSSTVEPALLEQLRKNGLQCGISNHAGTFVCNELYYRALHNWQDAPRCAGVVFAHVPPAAAYADANSKKVRTVNNSPTRSHRSLSKTAQKKVDETSSQDEDDVYPIYRYAEALALIARHLLK